MSKENIQKDENNYDLQIFSDMRRSEISIDFISFE